MLALYDAVKETHPGPWRAERRGFGWAVVSAGGLVVADVREHELAELISKLPDLCIKLEDATWPQR